MDNSKVYIIVIICIAISLFVLLINKKRKTKDISIVANGATISKYLEELSNDSDLYLKCVNRHDSIFTQSNNSTIAFYRKYSTQTIAKQSYTESLQTIKSEWIGTFETVMTNNFISLSQLSDPQNCTVKKTEIGTYIVKSKEYQQIFSSIRSDLASVLDSQSQKRSDLDGTQLQWDENIEQCELLEHHLQYGEAIQKLFNHLEKNNEFWEYTEEKPMFSDELVRKEYYDTLKEIITIESIIAQYSTELWKKISPKSSL